MSTTVDQRVVEMRFDNKHFENNVKTTMSSLDRLKQSLNLTGASKGLENINTAANRVNFSGITSGIETVQTKFSYMQATIQHQINRIVDSTIAAGKKMVSALTIDPIKSGFTEYETQINAVQTILANTSHAGTTLQDVNKVLDDLNLYADKTIYNFTQMTRNIGTFTAAGLGLEESAAAIKGIANLAAVSGSTSQQASTAMYQLSQALANGKVNLQDWNSVVNAGMGGKVFQDALVRTAAAMKGVSEETFRAQNITGSFRESISSKDGSGWLSAEILSKTLQQFTGDMSDAELAAMGFTESQIENIQKMAVTANEAATKVKTFTQLWDTLKEAAQSGWTQSWEIMVGDFEEAKEELTKISDTIGGMLGESADRRNTMLSEGLSSGWKQLLGKGIVDEVGFQESIEAIAKDHGVAFDEIIKKTEEAGGSFEDALVVSLRKGKISSEMLTESVTHLGNKMRNMTDEEKKAAGYTDKTIETFEKLEAGLKDGSISMDEFVTKMTRLSGRQNIIQGLWNSFNALLDIIKPIKEAFTDIFPPMTGEQLYLLTERFRKLTENFKISDTTADNIKRTFKGLFALVDIGAKAISALFKGFSKLSSYIVPAGNGLLGFTAGIGDFLVSINNALESSDAFNKIIEKIGNFLKPIGEGIKEFAKSVTDSFDNISGTAKTRLEPLVVIGEFIKSIFVGIGKLIGKVAPIVSSLASELGQVFGNLFDNIASSIQGADYSKLFDIFNGGVFAAIGVYIAKFMKSASGILDDTGGFVENIKDILEGTGDAINAFTGSLKAETLKKIATAIGILAGSLLVLSLIESDKLAGSLAAITVLFAELSGAMAIFGKIGDAKGFKNIIKIATAMTSMSISLLILAAAMKVIGSMSWDEMARGLLGLAGGLGILVGALWLLPDGKFKRASAAIKQLTGALLVFSVAMKILGSLSWNELGVGLTAMAVGLGVLVGALWLIPKDMSGKAGAMVILASSLVILGGALKIMSTMSWDEIGRSLAALAGSLLILAAAMTLMKKAIPGAAAILVVAPALIVLSGALKIMSTMLWDEIGRGLVVLAGSLFIIAGAMIAMKKAIPGAAALIVVSSALMILAPMLKILGSMSWGEIVRGLTTLAGAFTIIGVAGLLLRPLIPTILALSGSIALLGIGCAAIGAGVLMVGVGITSLAAALASGGAAITLFVSSIIGLIPYLIEQIGIGIVKFCQVISGSAAAICEAFSVIISALVDAIVVSVPKIAEGIFVLIDELLGTLVEYTPKIVTALFDFLIEVINAVAEKMPDLIKAGVNLLMSFFEGVVNALKNIDPNVLVNGILSIGMLTTLMLSLSAIAALTPSAMIGVLGLGATITELAIVLAAIGALAQIPGLEWLISEGGVFLQTIGTAIGRFIGGIVGGVAVGITSSLPQMGTDLSNFMTNLKPFIDGVKSFDAATIDGVKSLVGVILALTAADVVQGLTSWFTGGSSLGDFGTEIAAFAPNLKTYADAVKGIDGTAVEASANAAKALSELANSLPNSGGVAGFFAGENNLSEFAAQLVPFGNSMKEYSMSIAGFNAAAVIASANAAKSLVEMTNCIPNSGGIVAWFTGENSVTKFAADLVKLGGGLSAYSESITGFNAEAVVASANAAKALAQMTSYIPNEGGIVAWLTGESSISKFGTDLVSLGNGLKGFSDSIIGINIENVTAASTAAQTLAQMVSHIPNEGGLAAWFTGENSVSRFSADLVALGGGLLGFSTAVIGINAENITAAAGAAQSLAQMMTYIPNSGGLTAWFTGENSVSKFAGELPALGKGLKDFSISVLGINAENITAAAGAAKALAEMTNTIPKEGGIKAWFTGETAVSNFAEQLPSLGKGLKGFSESVAGINAENITAASNAAKSLAQMADTAPSDSSMIISFGENLVTFGDKLKTYFSNTSGITPERISASTNAINSIKNSTKGLDSSSISSASTAIKELVSAVKGMSQINENAASGFSNAMKKLCETNVNSVLKSFESAGPKMSKAGQTLLNKFIEGANKQKVNMTKAGETAIKNFCDGIKAKENSAKQTCDKLVASCAKSLSSASSKFKTAGSYLVSGFADGISANTFKATAQATAMANAAEKAAREALKINSPSKVFRAIGYSVPEGFANGIEKMSRMVTSASTYMTDVALKDVKDSVSNIANLISADMDTQPTIRPVLDLTNVKSGVNSLSSIFNGNPTIGVSSNLRSISATMNDRQNGFDNGDIISAIKDLKSEIGKIQGTTNIIEGVTYGDDSSISNAVQSLVRAATIERRI